MEDACVADKEAGEHFEMQGDKMIRGA